jgi:DNA-binding transcriptional ArsR family regulator
MTQSIDPISMLRPRRKPVGISALLLPFTESGDVDWPAFTAHLTRTAEAGLTPAVNMDTGYVHLIDDALRRAALERTRATLGGGNFVAGAFVADRPGDRFDADGYKRQIAMIQEHGGTPVRERGDMRTAYGRLVLLSALLVAGAQPAAGNVVRQRRGSSV